MKTPEQSILAVIQEAIEGTFRELAKREADRLVKEYEEYLRTIASRIVAETIIRIHANTTFDLSHRSITIKVDMEPQNKIS